MVGGLTMDPNIMIGVMGTIIVGLFGLVGAMYRTGRNHRNYQGGNPGSHCEAMAAADKVKLAISEGLKPLIAIETLLEQRPCLGEQMRDALVETLRRGRE